MREVLFTLIFILSGTALAAEKKSSLEKHAIKQVADRSFIKELPMSGVSILDVAHLSSVDLDTIQSGYGYLKNGNFYQRMYLMLVPKSLDDKRPNYSLIENRNDDFKRRPIVTHGFNFNLTPYFEETNPVFEHTYGVFIYDVNSAILADKLSEGKLDFDIEERPVYFFDVLDILNTILVTENYQISRSTLNEVLPEHLEDITNLSRNNGIKIRILDTNTGQNRISIEITAPPERIDKFIEDLESRDYITSKDE